jgi:hypothetical protein
MFRVANLAARTGHTVYIGEISERDDGKKIQLQKCGNPRKFMVSHA